MREDLGACELREAEKRLLQERVVSSVQCC